jgi:hypothetical protein
MSTTTITKVNCDQCRREFSDSYIGITVKVEALIWPPIKNDLDFCDFRCLAEWSKERQLDQDIEKRQKVAS